MNLGIKSLKGLIWGQIGMSGRTVICFLVSILVARFLGAANYGIYTALTALVAMLSRFTEMGTQTIFSTFIPRFSAKRQPGFNSYIVRRVLLIRLALIGTGALLLLLFSGPLIALIGEPRIGDYLILIAIWFIVRAAMDTFVYIVWARVEMKYYARVEILVSIIQLAGVGFLWQWGMTITNLVMLMILINGLQLLFYILNSVKVIRHEPEPTSLRPVISMGLTVWLATILHVFISKGIDIVLILHFLNDSSQVAYYNIAHLLVFTGGLGLLSSMGILEVPIMSEAHARQGMEGMKKAWLYLTKLSLFISAPVLIFLAVHAETIVTIFYSETYLPSSPLIAVFSILALAGLLLANEASAMILFPLHKQRLFLYLRGANGVLNLVFNILLIPRYGIMGAVFATGGSRLLISVFELAFAMKILRVRLPLEFIIKLLAVIAVSISWTLLIKDMNIALLATVALFYGVMVTLLLFRLHRFSNSEKLILAENHPGMFRFLNKWKILP
jgi:O-antigen/teichoic acid export membrane protein